jgi:predicted dehydrogenase
MNKLKVGIVGCGFIARRRHIPAFLRLKSQVSLCAVCDLDHNLATKVAKKFGITKVYTDFFRMLSQENLDIIDICTPPHTHAFLAIEAMKNGCHVLSEKPMATKLSDCDKMIRASKKYGTKLSVVHNQRFYPPFLKAQKLVEEGRMGKLLEMRVLSLTPRTVYMIHKDHWIHKLPGGAISETGPHTVYLSLAFLRKVTDIRVKAWKAFEYPWVLYDNYRIYLEGENVDSAITISHASNYRVSEVDLICEEALIRLDLLSMLLMIYKSKTLDHLKLALSSLDTAGQIIKGVISNASLAVIRKTFLGHDIMIEKFVESVMYDRPVPVPAEEGREAIRIMEVIINKLTKEGTERFRNGELKNESLSFDS